MDENINNGDVNIILKVVGEDSNQIHFRVKMSTKMSKWRKVYAERVGVPISSIRFFLDGQEIDENETPDDFEYEEGDVIEAHRNVNENSSDAADNFNSESSNGDDDVENGSQHIKFTTLEDMELFHQAAKSGSLQDIRKLCEKDGFLHVNSRIQDDTQKTPLHRAAESGHENVVEFLIKHDADTDAKDKDDWTPLQYACRFGHIKIIKLLLNPSSIIQTPSQQFQAQERPNKFENTPLALLLENNRIQVAEDEIQITESAEPVPSTSAEPVLSTSAEPVPSTNAEPVPSTSMGIKRRTNQTSENIPETEMSRAKRTRIAQSNVENVSFKILKKVQ